ncbi:hypothetical protein K7X08_025682 [Anisodus acutangulus]|uniref:Uncharacterized protein n=1 Tax=Anisodus acutangulus TaxID=402998 RepID=A0A9Q1LX23_9SOLA|nr:hypothetical protein K7X08_025682 [Anisodus acutangulus]
MVEESDAITDDFANPADVQDYNDEDPSDEDVVVADGNGDVAVDITMGLNEVLVQLEEQQHPDPFPIMH